MGRAPTKELLAARAPEEVYDALTIGRDEAHGRRACPTPSSMAWSASSPASRRCPTRRRSPTPNLCKTNGPLQPNGPQWNGWGRDLANSRYQPKPGFTAAEIPRLKVKWAFAYPGTKNSQPLVFGDRVFVASHGRQGLFARRQRPAASTGATTGAAARAPR